MPKHEKSLNRTRAFHPYRRSPSPPVQPINSLPPPPPVLSQRATTESICPLVPFEDLVVGRFYNAAISFQPDRPGGHVPAALAKHRVLLQRIDPMSNSVEVYYITTFGNGRTSPTRFHRGNTLQRRMYLPLSPLAFPGYLSIRSTPPVLKGWLNFGRSAEILYGPATPSRQLLRHPPESFGVRPPLLNAPIVLDAQPLGYVRAMAASWLATIRSGQPLAQWLAEAERLRTQYNAVEQPAVIDADEDDAQYGPEWCGITCVS